MLHRFLVLEQAKRKCKYWDMAVCSMIFICRTSALKSQRSKGGGGVVDMFNSDGSTSLSFWIHSVGAVCNRSAPLVCVLRLINIVNTYTFMISLWLVFPLLGTGHGYNTARPHSGPIVKQYTILSYKFIHNGSPISTILIAVPHSPHVTYM